MAGSLLPQNPERLPTAAYRLTGCGGDFWVFDEEEEILLEALHEVDLIYRDGLTAPVVSPYPKVRLALVEGAVVSREDERRLRAIRESAQILIALGTCAVWGGLPASKDTWGGKVRPAAPLRSVVAVDYALPGCPVSPPQFASLMACALRGRPLVLPVYPVCFECRLTANPCLWQTAPSACLGPVTGAGCTANCPSQGVPCYGCHGPAAEANVESYLALLRKKGYTAEEAVTTLRTFGSNLPARLTGSREEDE